MKPTACTLALPQRLSLVDQTITSLRQHLTSGVWEGNVPGERELCEHLNVSRTTIRAALEEMQRKGWLTVKERFRRKITSPVRTEQLRPEKRTVALLFSASLQSLHSRTMFVADAVRAHLARSGYTTESHVQSGCFSQRPDRALEKLALEHPAAVWVVFGSREPMQRWFMRRKLPLLVFGSCRPGIAIPSIDADHHAACHHAGGALWRRGHKRIGLLLPQKAFGGEVDSENGLRKALQGFPKARLQLLPHDGTAAHVCALLDKTLRSSQPPTAFLVTHAEHAITALTHLQRLGKRVPQDVAIIARDDHPFLLSTSPVIAHYLIDPAQLARRVAMAAHHLVRTGILSGHPIRLMPKFVPGGTV